MSNQVDEVNAAIGGAVTIVGMVLVLMVVVLVIAAVIGILVHGNLTAGGKLLWVLGVLWLPVLGAVAWFVVGRTGHLNRLLGIDKGRDDSPGRHADTGTAGGLPPPGPA